MLAAGVISGFKKLDVGKFCEVDIVKIFRFIIEKWGLELFAFAYDSKNFIER